MFSNVKKIELCQNLSAVEFFLNWESIISSSPQTFKYKLPAPGTFTTNKKSKMQTKKDPMLSPSFEAELDQILALQSAPTKNLATLENFIIDSDLERELHELAKISDRKIDNGEKNILEQIVKQSGIDSQLDSLRFQSNSQKPQISPPKNLTSHPTNLNNALIDSDLEREINTFLDDDPDLTHFRNQVTKKIKTNPTNPQPQPQPTPIRDPISPQKNQKKNFPIGNQKFIEDNSL